jgi:hypothetical protein
MKIESGRGKQGRKTGVNYLYTIQTDILGEKLKKWDTLIYN